jgi:hypothetical protein
MQLIPVGAAVISLVIKQWSTSIVLILITLFNVWSARAPALMSRTYRR